MRMIGEEPRRGLLGYRPHDGECGEVIANVADAGTGLGITMLPRALAEGAAAAASLSVLAPPAGEATADTVFVRRRDALGTSALRVFLARAGEAFALVPSPLRQVVL